MTGKGATKGRKGVGGGGSAPVYVTPPTPTHTHILAQTRLVHATSRRLLLIWVGYTHTHTIGAHPPKKAVLEEDGCTH